MSLSRRSFVWTLGVSGVGALVAPAIAARGREALSGIERHAAVPALSTTSPIRLDSNENPNGPGRAAIDAILGSLTEASRYPDQPEDALQERIARTLRLPVENIVTGCGSTEILRMAVQQFTSSVRPLVTAAPTFEAPARFAVRHGASAIEVPVDGSLKLDLETMGARGIGAGLIYLCNPNNPTGTAHGKEAIGNFVARVGAASPDTTILIDEAYFEYVEDPACATAIPIATANRRVIVSRTFSKLFGLAGLRVGYAVGSPSTVAALGAWRLPSGVNLAGASAAPATLTDTKHIETEARLNREAKAFTRTFFEDAGYRVVPSETNFMMIDIRRDARRFRDLCREGGVRIGRPFPPLNSFTRISIGTMGEMRRAVAVFDEVLRSAGSDQRN